MCFVCWPVEGVGNRTTLYEWGLFSACYKFWLLQTARGTIRSNNNTIYLVSGLGLLCISCSLYFKPLGVSHDLFDRMLTPVFS